MAVCHWFAIEDIEGNTQLVYFPLPCTSAALQAGLNTSLLVGMVLVIKSPLLNKAKAILSVHTDESTCY